MTLTFIRHRYAVSVVTEGGEQAELCTRPTLRLALQARDQSRHAHPGPASLYLVHDREIPEAGYAEWCECGQEGAFAASEYECIRCRRGQAVA